jgi:hypothetical protein
MLRSLELKEQLRPSSRPPCPDTSPCRFIHCSRFRSPAPSSPGSMRGQRQVDFGAWRFRPWHLRQFRCRDGRTRRTSLPSAGYRPCSAGASVPVRWSTVPVHPVAVDSTEPAAAGDKNYLFDDLIAQIAQHPPQWRLIITIGQSDDPTNDATLPWPEGRRQIDAGTITIDQASSEDGGRCTAVNYDPLVLPSGIEPSDDPLLSARSASYARSFTLRAEEEHQKPPSAVTVQEVQTGGKS